MARGRAATVATLAAASVEVGREVEGGKVTVVVEVEADTVAAKTVGALVAAELVVAELVAVCLALAAKALALKALERLDVGAMEAGEAAVREAAVREAVAKVAAVREGAVMVEASFQARTAASRRARKPPSDPPQPAPPARARVCCSRRCRVRGSPADLDLTGGNSQFHPSKPRDAWHQQRQPSPALRRAQSESTPRRRSVVLADRLMLQEAVYHGRVRQEPAAARWRVQAVDPKEGIEANKPRGEVACLRAVIGRGVARTTRACEGDTEFAGGLCVRERLATVALDWLV